MPPEICEIHDNIIDEYGCWACGHNGPITDEVADAWAFWAIDPLTPYKWPVL